MNQDANADDKRDTNEIDMAKYPDWPPVGWPPMGTGKIVEIEEDNSKYEVDMVNHPPHYKGPEIELGGCDEFGEMTYWSVNTYELSKKRWWNIECITILRHIKDPRLATAFKYIWRAAFEGKVDRKEDVKKAIWYLNDYVEHDV